MVGLAVDLVAVGLVEGEADLVEGASGASLEAVPAELLQCRRRRGKTRLRKLLPRHPEARLLGHRRPPLPLRAPGRRPERLRRCRLSNRVWRIGFRWVTCCGHGCLRSAVDL